MDLIEACPIDKFERNLRDRNFTDEIRPCGKSMKSSHSSELSTHKAEELYRLKLGNTLF
jgi:hypothetical protein